jgi:hypothetical protein
MNSFLEETKEGPLDHQSLSSTDLTRKSQVQIPTEEANFERIFLIYCGLYMCWELAFETISSKQLRVTVDCRSGAWRVCVMCVGVDCVVQVQLVQRGLYGYMTTGRWIKVRLSVHQNSSKCNIYYFLIIPPHYY